MEQNLFGNNPVFVTGASGLLGTHIIALLLSKNISVKAFIRTEKARNQSIKMLSILMDCPLPESLIEWHYGDITDFDSVVNAMHNCKYVFHCAGFVSFAKNDKEKLMEINYKGTQNIVNAGIVNSITKLCHVSSVAALGKANNKDFVDENCSFELTNITSPYNHSKYLAELEVWRGIAEGLQAVIINPSVILGIGNTELTSTAIFGTIKKGLAFYTRGSTGFVCATDVVQCMFQLMISEHANERFLISAENIEFKTVFTSVAKSLQVAPPYKEAKKWQVKLVGFISEIISFFTKKSPAINRYSAQSATSYSKYSNAKICNTLGYTFNPIHEEIQKIGKALKAID